MSNMPNNEDKISNIFQRNIFDKITYIDRLAEYHLIKGCEESTKEINNLLKEVYQKAIDDCIEKARLGSYMNEDGYDVVELDTLSSALKDK